MTDRHAGARRNRRRTRRARTQGRRVPALAPSMQDGRDQLVERGHLALPWSIADDEHWLLDVELREECASPFDARERRRVIEALVRAGRVESNVDGVDVVEVDREPVGQTVQRVAQSSTHDDDAHAAAPLTRSEEHTSEQQY